MEIDDTRRLILSFEPAESSAATAVLPARTAMEDARINERLRRYFSDFATDYIQQEALRTGKPLGIIVEELLKDRLSGGSDRIKALHASRSHRANHNP
jgi:hypothetical protein